MPAHPDAAKAFNSLVGQRLADLEVIELLAESATTAVYRARQAALNRQVAVKVLSADEARDPRLVERFKGAALAAAAVEHPGIVQVFQAGAWHGHHFVVMELVHGESLEAVLNREGRLGAERALPLMRQAASALAAAHAAGVIHGDIQPSNLLVTKAGQLKVADFSLARCSDSDKGPAAAGTPHSKPLYFPPEAARGRRLDARSDLYLLGATFYHVLAGRPPFEAASPEELALKAVREDPPPLRSLAPKTPPALAHIVHHLLQRNPDERFQRADELAGALERIESELEAERRPAPAPAAPEAAGERAGRPGLRAAAGLAALAALAAIVILAYIALTSSRRPSAPSAGPKASTETPVPPEKPEPKVTTEVPPAKPPEETPKARTDIPPARPAWEADLAAAEAKAKALADFGRFGEAIACFDALLEGRDEPPLRERAEAAKDALAQAAEAAGRAVAEKAREAAARGDFEAARRELLAFIARCGVQAAVADARKLAAAIEDQEKAAKAKARPEPGAELARLREAEAEALRALDEAAEPLARAWDFAGAAAAAAALKLPSPEAAAFATRRAEELNRLAQLKDKMIKHITTAEPKLMKSSVFIPGLNGPLTEATHQGIVASHPGPKEARKEVFKWAELSERTVRALALAAIDKGRGDDWLALGLLEALRDNVAAAEEDFARARSLGADTARHAAPLARASLASAEAQIARGGFRDAIAALEAIEKSYAETPWLKLHQEDVAAARARATASLAESTAEELLARAAECLKRDEPYEARRLLNILRKDHAASRAVADAARKPSFAELADAVGKLGLGPFIAVRKDGSGDARSVAEAIQAATAKTLIEVQDAGPYAERLVIPEDKAELHLRGKPGAWPVITSEGLPGPPGTLLEVRAPQVILEGLVLAHGGAKAPVREGKTLAARAGPLRVRSCIIAVAPPRGARPAPGALAIETEDDADPDIQGCVVAGPALLRGVAAARDSLWLAGRLRAEHGKFTGENLLLAEGAELLSPAELRRCTIRGDVVFRDAPNVLTDSIVTGRAESVKAAMTLDLCILGSLGGGARAGPQSSFAPPQFENPLAFDYRLRRGSRGTFAASDKGDLGCRYSAAMLDILRHALELRRKGILAF